MDGHENSQDVAEGRHLLVAVCCVAMFALGCGGSESGDAGGKTDTKATSRSLNVNVIKVVRDENVFDSRSYFGTVKPRRSSNLGFSRGGRVKAVSKSVGDKVVAKEVLAILEQTQLDDSLTDVDKEIGKAQKELDSLPANVNNFAPQIKTLQQQIARLQGQRRDILTEIEKGKILAPYPGVIAFRDVNEGDSVPAGRRVFKVIDDSPPNIEVDVALATADRIKKGDTVWVLKGAESIEVRLATKSPEVNSADRRQTLILDVIETQPARNWAYGEIVEVRFWVTTTRSGFWLPYSSLQRDAGGLWSAYVIEGDADKQTVSRRTVELLQIHDDIVLVRGSLKGGDLVIADGSNRVVPGQRVAGTTVRRRLSKPGPPGTSE